MQNRFMFLILTLFLTSNAFAGFCIQSDGVTWGPCQSGGSGRSGSSISPVPTVPQWAPPSEGEVLYQRMETCVNLINAGYAYSRNCNTAINNLDGEIDKAIGQGNFDSGLEMLGLGARYFNNAIKFCHAIYSSLPRDSFESLVSAGERECYRKLRQAAEKFEATKTKFYDERDKYRSKKWDEDKKEWNEKESSRSAGKITKLYGKLYERIAANVANAQTVESTVQIQNAATRTRLSDPVMTPLLEKQAADYIREQLDHSEKVAQEAVQMAQKGSSAEAIQLVTDFAKDLSVACFDAVDGLAKGIYQPFRKVTDAMYTLYKNPALIGHLYGNMMNSITSRQFPTEVSLAFQEFLITVATGNAYEKGEAIGKFGGNIAIALAGTKVFSPEAVEGLNTSSLGAKLEAGIRVEGVEKGTEAITTFHIKTVEEIAKMAPSLGWTK